MSATSEPHLRRSKRFRKQPTNHNEYDEQEASDDTSRPLKKRSQSSANEQVQKTKTTRRKRGFLQRLKELPLDVVFEIFTHLTPHDLLHLSRTSKDLRKVLLSRSTISVWKSARENVDGLPDIPEDMSEPAYAHLCFDVRCHHCDNKHPAVNLLWHSRTRSCHGCMNLGFYFKEAVYRSWREDQEWRICPQSSYLPIFHELWDIIRYRGDIRKDNRRTYYFYCSENLKEQLVTESLANRENPDWKQRKIDEGKAIDKHAQRMQEWWQHEAKSHRAELEKRRRERENEILQRLADNGWGEELQKQGDINGLEFLYELGIGTRAKKLTESDWNELEPKLEQAFTQAKERRLIKEQRDKWRQRYHDFKELLKQELEDMPFNSIGPSVFDIANLPEFEEKLFTPIDHQVTRDDLADLLARLPEIRAQWIKSREEDLVGLLKDKGVDHASTDTLHHASTIFNCTECSSQCSYPKPLIHRCSRMGGYYGFAAFGNTPSFIQFLSNTGGKVWNIKQYTYDEDSSRMAKALLSVCGLPPDAKLEDVRQSNIWLECHDPVPLATFQGRTLYTLCRAIYTPSRSGRWWTIAGEEDTARATRESEISGSMIHVAMCNHCQAVVGSYGIIKHLQNAHDLTTFGPDDLTPSLEEELWNLDYNVVRLRDPTLTPEATTSTPII